MTSPRILLTGASGFVGSAIAMRLVAADFAVTGVARDPETAARRVPAVEWVAGDFNTDHRAKDWTARLKDISAVVNCAGVLQDGLGDNLENVHVKGAEALFEAAQKAGIRRVIQISAVGAEPDAETAFMRTKAEGDRRLRQKDLDWVVLRPGLVIGRPVYGGMGLIRGLAALPFVSPAIGGAKPMQVTGLEDLSDEVVRFLSPDAPVRATYDVIHPEPNELADIIIRMRQWLGFRPAPIITLPAWTGLAAGKFGDLAGWLGWRAPIRSTAIKQTLAGVSGDPSGWLAATGAKPKPLSALPDPGPATVQDRWHARLWAARPLALITIALFWIVSGLVALWPSFGAASAILTGAGIGTETAMATTAATALADIALGLGALVKRTHKAALSGMILVSLAYVVGGTVLTPYLWSDPLAPLLKILPQILLAAMLLATSDDR